MPASAHADAVDGTVFTYTCCDCGVPVCVAPGSQALLKADPSIEVVCMLCFVPEPDDVIEMPEQIAAEITKHFRKKAH